MKTCREWETKRTKMTKRTRHVLLLIFHFHVFTQLIFQKRIAFDKHQIKQYSTVNIFTGTANWVRETTEKSHNIENIEIPQELFNVISGAYGWIFS